ncbi:MAG: HAMP domain-containing protein [Clostridia bacterium]|nr:HAMP domain-containing protein [Clostridia bacterium]
MKGPGKLSIKARITLWYAALIVMICTVAIGFLFFVSRHAQDVYCRDTLQSAMVVILDEMEIEHGVLEIDADIDEIPNVYASLFAPDGSLIYGRRRVDAPFEREAVRTVSDGTHSWVILDEWVDLPDYEPVWVRLHVSADLSAGVSHAIWRVCLLMLPLLAAAALLGGYMITKGALSPVVQMTQTASAIAQGSDLSQRCMPAGYGADGDELHMLSDTLDAMLDRLEASFEREKRFTGDAAHELRTPLNAMRMQGEYALSRDSKEEKDEGIALMLEKNEEMRMLVDQLLMLARLEAGRMPMEDNVDLAAMIEGIAQDMEPVAQEKDMRILTVLQAAGVRGNRAMLMRAVINLVDNAIRYGREGGTVRIELENSGDGVCIRVTDDGEGLKPDALAHVFERFWRADGARTTQGTGIGLSIVQLAARAHGGSAQVHSEYGKGCMFTIRLPEK